MSLTLLLALVSPGEGAPQVGHRAWDVRDGLPVNGVQDLVMGPDGYLWVGTVSGVVRFDGARFTPAPLGERGPLRVGELAASEEEVWVHAEQGALIGVNVGTGALRETRAERWQLSEDGLLLLQEGQVGWLRGETFEPSRHPDLEGERWTRVLHQAGRGTWVSNAEEVLFLGVGGEAMSWDADEIGVGELLWAMEDGSGAAWVCGRGGLARMPASAGEAPERLLVGGEPWGGEAISIALQPDGSLRVAHPGGLYTWRDGALEPPLEGDLGRAPTAKALVDEARGRRWTLTRTQVLLDGEPVHQLAPGDGIVDATLDAEGGLWLATRRSGLHRLQPSMFGVVGLGEGLPSDNIYALAEVDGALWIGGSDTWLNAWEGGAMQRWGPEQGAPPDVMAIAQDAEGRLWVGSHGDGLFVAARPGAALEPVEALGPVDVTAIHLRPDGALWVGTSEGLWALEEGRWRRLALGLPDAPVRAIAEGAGGAVWLGMNGGGLARVRGGEAEVWGEESALGTGRVRWVLPLGEGAWVGTEDQGMVYAGPGGPTPRRLGPDEGLPDTYVHALLEDRQGALWGNSNQGLFRVDAAALASFAEGGPPPRVERYTELDGLPDREGNGGTQHAALRLSDGGLAFANQRGVVLVDPGAVDAEPPLLIARVEALGLDGERRLLWRSDAAPLQLSPEQRSFELWYTALNFRAPGRTRFQHRLVGLAEEWVDADTERHARFMAVPPGDYRFEVRALDARGRAGPVAAVALRRAPHVTETAWFRGLGVLGLVGLVVGAAWLRIRVLERREAELQALVDRQTAQLRADNAALAESRRVVAAQAERLQTVDRLKTRYFADLSHELRTPLTLILGPLDALLAPESGLPEARTRPLRLARQSAARLSGLVNQLLDVVKIDVGQLRLKPEPTDLGALLTQVTEELRPLAERKAQRLELDLPEALVSASLDRREAPKIFANLLSNAIKYTPEAGALRVQLSEVNGEAEVQVIDSGPGIAEADQERIFERFFMADGARSGLQPGTGLGLALARELSELHGGALELRSALGAGSCFVVRLPLAEGVVAPLAPLESTLLPEEPGPDPVTAPTAPPPEEDSDRTRVLVVDDHPGLRAWLRELLQDAYRVLEAADGAEGLKLAKAELPDLVLTDLVMPTLDGLGLLRALRADPETDWMPVIMLSARGSVASQVEGLERGADVYLSKPFSGAVLRAQVAGLIQQRQRLRLRFGQSELSPGEEDQEALLSADARYLRKVQAAVEAGLEDPEFGVQALADAVHQDRTHLFRRLKELTGQPPSALLREARLLRGASLLEAQVGNVSEVAYAVGFRSVAHFSTSFRKRFGDSPTAWLASREQGGE